MTARLIVLLAVFSVVCSSAQAASRLPVRSDGGMVVSVSRLSSEVGAEILDAGGNAIDAAVAVAFSLAVTWPSAGNLGGGGFMVIYLADEQRATAIDYREMAPRRAHRDMYLDAEGNVIEGGPDGRTPFRRGAGYGCRPPLRSEEVWQAAAPGGHRTRDQPGAGRHSWWATIWKHHWSARENGSPAIRRAPDCS